MAGNEYHFVSHWRVEGTVEEVSTIIEDIAGLPTWWPAAFLETRVLDPGDAQGVGKRVALVTKGWLPYTLRWQFRVAETHSPYGFALDTTGDFVGRGIWSFAQDGPWVDVTFDWTIRVDKPLVQALSGALKSLFGFNHRWAMRKGEESLKLELARRRAVTPDERAAVPAPPGPTPGSPVPYLVRGAGVFAVLYVGLRSLRRLIRRVRGYP